MTNLNTIKLISVEPSKWRALASGFADYNYEQSCDYVLSMARKSGSTARFYAVEDRGSVVGAVSLRIKAIPLMGRGVAYVSGGPLVARHDEPCSCDQRAVVLDALKYHLVEEEGHALFFRLPISPPITPECRSSISTLGFPPTHRVRSYRTIVVDISPDEPALMKQLAGKWRTDLKYSQKTGLTVEKGTDSGFFERFLKLFGEMQDVKNFDVHVDPRSFFELPADSLGLNVFIATKDGEDVAGHVLSMLGDTAVYLFGATNDSGRKTKAGYLLNWQSILLAKQHGLSWYDLGGIDPDSNPGVYRFKNKMGGQDITAAGPYEVLPNGASGLLIKGLLALRDKLVA